MTAWALVLILSALTVRTFATSKTAQLPSTAAFYGGPDNDPPWNDATAYNYDPSRGFHAGGTGSYEDPLSFATAAGEYKECEIVYSPYVKKYLRKDDFCASCLIPHIDIWTGSSITNRHGDEQIKCEEAMTPDKGQRVIRNPPKNLHVNSKCIRNTCLGIVHISG